MVIDYAPKKQANCPGFSGVAPIDRPGVQAEARLQNRADLVGAKRRPLQALVRPTRPYFFNRPMQC